MHCRYLVAKFFSPIFGCSTRALRLQNAFALSFIFYEVLQIRNLIQSRGHVQRKEEDCIQHVGDEKQKKEDPTILTNNRAPFSTALTAFNIASFPPLFFFGALYYTDVMSTATVLISYHAFLKTVGKPQRSISDDLIAVVSGIAALFFRQTNIFWVAVFPAGLTVLEVLKDNGSTLPSTVRQGYVAILENSWTKGIIYDRSLRDGGLAIPGMLFLDWRTTWLIQQDVLLFLLTTVIATLSSPIKVLRSIASYVILLVLFAGFVAWNGSVVLGK